MEPLYTERLVLLPITLPLVEAVLDGRRADAEALCGFPFPKEWPGRVLVEQAFPCPLGRLRDDPASFVWGGRILVSRSEQMVVGSVILNGRPDATGTVEVGYGIVLGAQGRGYATEGSRAVVEWVLQQPGVTRVIAATMAWHRASIRVIEKCGMRPAGVRENDMFGELVVFERQSAWLDEPIPTSSHAPPLPAATTV